ncbi:MAG: hypothetical protein ABI721_00695 [Candidatus Dojkabacteria bacterium]
MMKVGLGVIVGGLLLVFLCLCCCCMSILFLSRDTSFRTSYCTSYIKQGGKLSNEPFGWCR